MFKCLEIMSLIVMPLVLIWSLSTLFNLNINYNFWNWLAALFMFWFFRGDREHDKK